MTFKKGDKVVCVNDTVMGGHGQIPEVTKGKEYIVYSTGITPEMVCIMGTDNLPHSPQALYSSRFKLVDDKADCYVDRSGDGACTVMLTESQCVEWVKKQTKPDTYTIVRVLKIFKVESTTTVTEI